MSEAWTRRGTVYMTAKRLAGDMYRILVLTGFKKCPNMTSLYLALPLEILIRSVVTLGTPK